MHLWRFIPGKDAGNEQYNEEALSYSNPIHFLIYDFYMFEVYLGMHLYIAWQSKSMSMPFVNLENKTKGVSISNNFYSCFFKCNGKINAEIKLNMIFFLNLFPDDMLIKACNPSCHCFLLI